MSFTTFLLRLVGRSPEQIKEQERFEQNLKNLSEGEQELDSLVKEIREVDQAYQEKRVTCATVAQSVYPEAESNVGSNESDK